MIYTLLNKEDQEKVDFKMQAYGNYNPSEMTSPELMAKKKELHAGAKDLLDRADRFNRELTASEQNEYDEFMARMGRINQQIELYQANHTEAPINLKSQPMGSSPYGSTESKIKVLRPDQRITGAVAGSVDDENLSIGRYVKGLVTGEWKGADREFKAAMSEGVLTGGGHLVPTPLSTRIIDLARNQTRVIQAGALTVPMDSQTLKLAKVSGDPTANWKAESASIVESDMTFEALTLTAKTLVAMCRMSVELLEDAQNIDQVVQSALSQALALELDRAALFGVDPEPTGLYTTPGVQIFDMGVNGLALANYNPFSFAVEMVQGVNGEANATIIAPRTAGAIDRLVDTTEQPMLPPASFANLAKFSTNQIPVNLAWGTAVNASVAFVGQWNQMLIGTRTNLVLEVSREAGTAFTNLEVLVRAYLRADVQVAKPEQFVKIEGIIIPAA